MARPENATVGLATATASAQGYLGQDANSFGIHGTGGYTINGTFGNPSGVKFGAGSMVDIVADFAAKLFWVRADNGNWNGSASANPATGTGGLDMSSLSSFSLCPAVCLFDNGDSITGLFSGADIATGIPLWGGTWQVPGPTAITLTPVVSTVSDKSPAGTLLATATVTMPHGGKFTGTLTTSDTHFFAVSGLNIVTARALTGADDGSHTTTITAHQGGQALSARFSV